MESMEDVEVTLDQYYAARKNFISLEERRKMFAIIVKTPDPSMEVMKKFMWYNVFPINFDDGMWETFTDKRGKPPYCPSCGCMMPREGDYCQTCRIKHGYRNRKKRRVKK